MHLFRNKKKDFIRRVEGAKLLGAGVGILGLVFLHFYTEHSFPSALKWAIVLWYLTLGGIIGMAGVITKHPFFPKKFSRSTILLPIIRGGLMGAWLNFVLGIFISDTLLDMTAYMSDMTFSNTQIILLFALEGFVWGAIIDLISTKIAGQGKEIL